MPSVKLLVDDLVVYDSTSMPPNRSDPTVTMNNLENIRNPVRGDAYYYISPDDSKIYQGTLLRVNSSGYTMMEENGQLKVVDKIYVGKILKRGGKRRSRRTRRTNKRRKRSTKRRRH
jgi:hypothetical protein